MVASVGIAVRLMMPHSMYLRNLESPRSATLTGHVPAPSRANRWTALAIWTAVWTLSLTPFWQAAEWPGFDLLSVVNPPSTADSPLVIVGIDECSFAELGLQWPWPRRLHARLVDRLVEQGAKVIAFDVLFVEPSAAQDDADFATAIAKAGNVVLAADTAVLQQPQVTLTTRVEPLPLLLEAGAEPASVGLDLESDGTHRRFPRDRDSLWHVVLERWGVEVPIPAPDALVRYAGPPGSLPYVSYYQALDPETFLPPGLFRNRIVLVGLHLRASPAVAQQPTDKVATPFFRVYREMTSGVEAHANIIESAYRGTLIEPVSDWARLVLFAALGAGNLLLSGSWSPGRRALLSVLLTFATVGLAALLFFAADLWLPFTAPVAGIWIAYVGHGGVAFLAEQRRRRLIRAAFGRYVSENIIEHMLADPSRLALGGERRTVSFIFTDLADFTTLTESLDAERLVALLKAYFEGMCRIVLSRDGTIERLVGDSIVVFFNAPIDQPDHAARAVQCALALDSFGQRFAAEQQARGIGWGNTRIGVNTGEVTVGNFGGERWFHYTAMGDPINTAARLESANKYFGTRVCVSGATASLCPAMSFRPIGEVVLKGKTRSVALLEPVADETAAAGDFDGYLEAYARMAARAPDAAASFAALLRRVPSDTLARYHLERLRSGAVGTRIVLDAK
jgi:adenylate cyclase